MIDKDIQAGTTQGDLDDLDELGYSDDDWCPDCGETRPCGCDAAEDQWFDDSTED